jgi:solute carrier family 27 fatty acid transporter 1/4
MRALVKYGILATVLATLLQTFSSSLALGATLVVWYFLGGHHTLYLIYHTLDRDGRTAVRFVHLLWINLNAKWRNQSVGDLFLKTADRVPEKTMMVLCHETGEDKMTFRECREMACKVARYFLKQGYKKGDVVGLVMENRIDYCCYWIGLSMIGVIPALVNSNLRQQSLLHTLTVAKCKGVIFSSELCQAVLEIQNKVEVPLYCCDIEESSEVLNLPHELRSYSSERLTEKLADYNSALFYIYTSGTTGRDHIYITG